MSVFVPYSENLEPSLSQSFVFQSLMGTGSFHSQGGVESTPPHLVRSLVRLGVEIPPIILNGFAGLALDEIVLEELSLEGDIKLSPMLRKIAFGLQVWWKEFPDFPEEILALFGSTPAQVGQGGHPVSLHECLLKLFPTLRYMHEVGGSIFVTKPLLLAAVNLRILGNRGYSVPLHASTAAFSFHRIILKRILYTITLYVGLFPSLFVLGCLEMVNPPISLQGGLHHFLYRAGTTPPIHTFENLVSEISKFYKSFSSTITTVKEFLFGVFVFRGQQFASLISEKIRNLFMSPFSTTHNNLLCL